MIKIGYVEKEKVKRRTIEPYQASNSFSRFAVNIFSNIVGMGLNIVVGIWLTPYLLQHLGVASFGVVALALSASYYTRVISNSLNLAVGRYLTVDLHRNLFNVANSTFNTAFWSSIGISLLLLPLILALAIATPRFFDVPAGQEAATQVLFAMVMIAYLIGIIQGVFTTPTFSLSRFDLQNAITASNLLVRVFVIFLLFNFFQANMIYVGIGELLGGITCLIFAYFTWRSLTPELKISIGYFDKSRLFELSRISIWVLINEVGALLLMNIDLVIISIFLGATTAGLYGSILQWPLLLRVLAGTVSGVLTPLLISYYAHDDLDTITHLLHQAVKLLGLAMALPIGLIWGFAEPLLNLWLGPEFVQLAMLTRIQTIHLCVNLAVLPLFSVQVTLNKVRWPAIITLITGVAKLFLAIAWVNWGSNGLGVALAGAIILTLKNFFFTSLYVAHIQKLPWNAFLNSMIPVILATAGVGGVSYVISQIYILNSWFSVIGIGSAISATYMIFVYFMGLNPDNRKLLWSLLPGQTR